MPASAQPPSQSQGTTGNYKWKSSENASQGFRTAPYRGSSTATNMAPKQDLFKDLISSNNSHINEIYAFLTTPLFLSLAPVLRNMNRALGSVFLPVI